MYRVVGLIACFVLHVKIELQMYRVAGLKACFVHHMKINSEYKCTG